MPDAEKTCYEGSLLKERRIQRPDGDICPLCERYFNKMRRMHAHVGEIVHISRMVEQQICLFAFFNNFIDIMEGRRHLMFLFVKSHA